MMSNKINQNTAIINYQNTSFYVHCWRLTKEVKQKKLMLLCRGVESSEKLKVGSILSS